MATFYKLTDGTLINLDHIEHIGCGGENETVLWVKSEMRCATYEPLSEVIEKLQAANIKII